ncbi:diguanylate cyclase [Tardiphaga sp.]|uniref:GGDEF domain-containing protein n=1 Tax=Tardiphaga sp. TaxID=1926292 RepID=UPI00261FD18C|nr:diguanylate cyclase [Tardiphaga sp.]
MTAISPTQDPTGDDVTVVPGESPSEALTRRRLRRRQLLVFAAAFQVVNAALLLIFAAAGTIPVAIATAFTVGAVIVVGGFWALSEIPATDRWRDRTFAQTYAATTFALLLGFVAIAPQVAVVFLSALFLVAQMAGMRATPRYGFAIWIVITAGVATLYWLGGLSFSVPLGNPLERFGTLLTFSLTLGRIVFIGVFASSMQDALSRRRVELETAYKRIEELSELDELTGSYNRRCIMRMLGDETIRAHRTKSPCSIALIDLDWFKRINDTYGHPTGDEVLRTFSIAVFANIRAIDKFGRYGGEEFLLVLPDTPHDMAVVLLDRLRAIIATLDWSAFSEGLIVTISAGVATMEPDESPDALLARADAALYAAKAGGRNLIASA